jgi:hypothetical protein
MSNIYTITQEVALRKDNVSVRVCHIDNQETILVYGSGKIRHVDALAVEVVDGLLNAGFRVTEGESEHEVIT